MNKSILAIISLALVLVFAIFYLLPKYQELRYLGKEIKTKEAEVLKREERLNELKRIAEELKSYPEQLAKIDSALPSDMGLPALFDFIEKAGSQSGLVFKSIDHSAANPFPDFAEIKETEASLVFSGAYEAFKNFIPILETSARMVETQSISFTVDCPANRTADRKIGPREFELIIKVYSYQETPTAEVSK